MARKPNKDAPTYNLWQNTGYMIALAWKNQKSVLVAWVLWSVVGVSTNVLELFITPVILGKVEAAVPLPQLITTILLFALGLMLFAAINAYISTNALFGRVAVRDRLVRSIHHKVLTTSYPNTKDPDIIKKFTKANTAVSGNDEATEAIWDTLTKLLKNLIGFIIYLFVLSSLDTFLIAIVVVTALIGYFGSKRINEWGYRHREEQSEYDKKIRYIRDKAESTTLAKDIRIFGMRPWLEDVHNSALRLYQDFIMRGERVYIWADVMDVALSFLRNGIAYGYLISLTLTKGLPASRFLLYFTAVNVFTTWITGILTEFATLHKQSLEISIVREYLETPEPFLFEDGEALKPDQYGAYEICLKDVTFRYPGADKDTLHHFNLTIHPGEKLAVVGINGAGKTTLVKLICGFYDPTEGEVLLNGINIKKYNRQDYYKHFAAVFQEFSMLEVTLAENVAQSVDTLDQQKVEDCIEKAGMTKKVQTLPAQYETHIGRKVFEDGVELSGGETQRLMLARALYKDAPIIVLDEPTAALDPIAENDIYQKYNEMTSGRTAIYISHRLASTRFCDRIILIGDGNIVQQGTHASLLAIEGAYARLFQVQSRYYAEGGGIDEEK